MKKRGSILPYIFILIILFLAGYWFYEKYSIYPSKLTQETGESIYRYPNAKTWIQENYKGLCTFSAKNCSLSSKIIFTSDDDWATVYSYHAKSMQILGWHTNSTVYTSIPTGILFTNDNGCKAELTPKRRNIFEFTASKKGQYFFNVTCPS